MGAVALSGGLLADDVTVIGVADDALIPPVIIGGAIASTAILAEQYFLSKGKGERRKAAKPDGTPNPWKHTSPDPDDPTKIIYKDPHTGKQFKKPMPIDYPKKGNY